VKYLAIGSYNYNNSIEGANWVVEKIERSQSYFESIPLNPIYGSTKLHALAYERRLKCIVTQWKDGQFRVYYDYPDSIRDKNIVQ